MSGRAKADAPKAKRWIAIHKGGEACQVSFKTRERAPLKAITEEQARRVSRLTGKDWTFHILAVTMQCMPPELVFDAPDGAQ